MAKPWKITVDPVSSCLEVTSYAHHVHHGIGLPLSVAHHDHSNWDHIHRQEIGGGYVRQTGIGHREPNLTPHPLAVLISMTPVMRDYIAARAETDSAARDIMDQLAGKAAAE